MRTCEQILKDYKRSRLSLLKDQKELKELNEKPFTTYNEMVRMEKQREYLNTNIGYMTDVVNVFEVYVLDSEEIIKMDKEIEEELSQ